MGGLDVVKNFICMELYPLASKVLFLLIQSWKRVNSARSKANVQSSCFMVELGLVYHQASCSPLIHRVWGPMAM